MFHHSSNFMSIYKCYCTPRTQDFFAFENSEPSLTIGNHWSWLLEQAVYSWNVKQMVQILYWRLELQNLHWGSRTDILWVLFDPLGVLTCQVKYVDVDMEGAQIIFIVYSSFGTHAATVQSKHARELHRDDRAGPPMYLQWNTMDCTPCIFRPTPVIHITGNENIQSLQMNLQCEAWNLKLFTKMAKKEAFQQDYLIQIIMNRSVWENT